MRQWRTLLTSRGSVSLACLLLALTLPLAPIVYLGRAPLPDYLRWFAPWFDGTAPHTAWNALWFDAVGQYWPWRTLLAAGLHGNTLPLWNPFQFAGYAFCGNGQSALYYPPNWLCFGLFGVADGFRLTALLHLWLAAVGAYLLLRELGGTRAAGVLAGCTFALSGFMVDWLMLPTLPCSAAWLPWAAAGIERCRRTGRMMPAAGAGVAVGLSGLAGHPQIFYYVAATAGLLALVRLLPRRWPGLVLFAALGGALAAPMVLPLLELAPRSHRPPGSGGDYATFRARAVPADRLVTQVLPDFYGDPSRGTVDPTATGRAIATATADGAYWGTDRAGAISSGDYTEFALYIGLVSLGLLPLAAARGGTARLHAVLALAALLLAYGSPIGAPLYAWLPGFSSGAGPCRLAVVWSFAAAVSAGLALDHARRQPPSRRELAMIAGWLAGLLVIGWVLARRSSAAAGTAPLLEVATWRNLLACLVLLPGAALGLWLLRRAPRWLPALAAVELIAAAWGFNPSCEKELLDPTPPLLRQLTKETDAVGGRMVVLDPPQVWGFYRPPAGLLLPPNLATAAGIRDLGGYDSLLPAAHKQQAAALCGGQPTPLINGNMLLLGNGPRSWPGCLVLLRADATGEVAWRLGFGSPARVGPSGEAGGAPAFDGYNRVAVTIGRGAELLRDSPYPGWRAYAVQPLGGVREVGWHAGDGCRVLNQPLLGEGQVRWVFAPVTVRLGVFAALCGLAICAAMWAGGEDSRGRRRSGRSES